MLFGHYSMNKKLYSFLVLGSVALVAIVFIAFVYKTAPNLFTYDYSYINPFHYQFSSPNTRKLSVLFIGDMMFDRGVRSTVNKKSYEYVFGDSPLIFNKSDIVVGNLEGPITTYPSKTLLPDGTQHSDLLVFTFPTSTAQALKNNGVDIVTLANNHEQNFGRDGINLTKKYLSDADVSYFGDPENYGDISTTTCKKGICMGLIGFNEFTFKNEANIIQQIHELRPYVDQLVIFPHWGEEYNTSYIALQQRLAHQWIDEGADLIIGSHPHVVEPIETYKGKTIFYSLGNYMFDQYFSFDTTHGLAVRINFTKNFYTYELIPIDNTGNTIKIPDKTTSALLINGIKKLP